MDDFLFLWAEAINNVWLNLILATGEDFQQKFYFWICLKADCVHRTVNHRHSIDLMKAKTFYRNRSDSVVS